MNLLLIDGRQHQCHKEEIEATLHASLTIVCIEVGYWYQEPVKIREYPEYLLTHTADPNPSHVLPYHSSFSDLACIIIFLSSK